jgi:hypothetical protein
MQRPESEILALGAFTKDLLSNVTFNALFKEYTDQMLTAIVSSAPHEVKVREFEYAKSRAMLGFLDHLAGFAEAAQNIINKSNDPDQSDED